MAYYNDRSILSGIQFLDLTNVSDEDAHRINKVLSQTANDSTVEFLQDLDQPFVKQITGVGAESEEEKDAEHEEPMFEDGSDVESQPIETEIPIHPAPVIPELPPRNVPVPSEAVHSLAYPVTCVTAPVMPPGFYAPVPSIYVNTMTANVNVHSPGLPYMPHLRPYEEPPKMDAEQKVPGFAHGHGPPPFLGPAFVQPVFHHPSPQSVTGAPFVIQGPYYVPVSHYAPVVTSVGAPPKPQPVPIHVSPKKPVEQVTRPVVQPEPAQIPEVEEKVQEKIKVPQEDLQFGDVTGVEITDLQEKKAAEMSVSETVGVAPVASSESSEVTSPEPEAQEDKKVDAPLPPVETQKPKPKPADEPRVASPASAAVAAPSQPVAAPSKSWASLFKSEAASKPVAKVAPVVAPAPVETTPPPATCDPDTHKLAVHLSQYALEHEAASLQPRGLLNKGNYCYINAVLQVLIGCPPFYKMIKAIEPLVKTRTSTTTKTPVIDSLVNYVSEFVTLPPPATPTPKAKKAPIKPVTEVNQGQPFEPATIYGLLQSFTAFKEMGRQEDAEELLTVLLNALNDEMIELAKLVSKPATVNGTATPQMTNGNSEDPDEWQVIGPKNKGTITRAATFCKTPVSDLFLGQMRSALQTEKGQSTATLQPFFTLQLDIQNEKVTSVKEALDALVTKEPLLGYIDPKNKQEVEALRQTTLEALPPVLMLHLKCFLYDKFGGCQKLIKKIDVPLDLEIQKDVLSPSIKTKLSPKHRQYHLFAVVYHDGKEATKGHYVADVHHPGLGAWIRYDDSVVKVVDEKNLLKHSPPRVPYLLLYRRKES